MSKARAQARAVRQAEAAARAEAARLRQAREAAERTRRERRALIWRRLRLWQHTSSFQRRKEAWAGLAALVLVAVLVSYFLTGSWHVVLLVVLVLIIGAPVLIMLTFDRSSR